MDMYDFFFPEQAQASHLRRIARAQVSAARAPNRTLQQAEEMAELRSDVQFLTLVIAAMLKRMNETQTMSMDDVQDLIDEIDGLDGVPDGGLAPGVLRGLLGVLRQQPQRDAANDELQAIADMHHRYRR